MLELLGRERGEEFGPEGEGIHHRGRVVVALGDNPGALLDRRTLNLYRLQRLKSGGQSEVEGSVRVRGKYKSGNVFLRFIPICMTLKQFFRSHLQLMSFCVVRIINLDLTYPFQSLRFALCTFFHAMLKRYSELTWPSRVFWCISNCPLRLFLVF